MFYPITIKNQPLYSDFEGLVNVECGTTGDWGSGSRGPAQRLTKRAACPHAAASWEHGKATRSGVLGRPPTTSTHARNKARTHTVGPGRGLMYVHTKKRAKERPEHRLLPLRQRAALVCAYIYQCLLSLPPPPDVSAVACCVGLCAVSINLSPAVTLFRDCSPPLLFLPSGRRRRKARLLLLLLGLLSHLQKLALHAMARPFRLHGGRSRQPLPRPSGWSCCC